jgi:hypothetical protein
VVPLLRPKCRTDLDEKWELPFLESRSRLDPNPTFAARQFFEELERRGVDRERTLERFAQECQVSANDQNISWLGACIQAGGTRKDLAMLNGRFTGIDESRLTKLRMDSAFTVKRRSTV